jgi:hypothetical protein
MLCVPEVVVQEASPAEEARLTRLPEPIMKHSQRSEIPTVEANPQSHIMTPIFSAQILRVFPKAIM